MPERIRVAVDGSIKLPEKIREKLGWASSSFLEFEVMEDRVEIWKVEVDLFTEVLKKPDEDGFDKVMKKQKESQSAAFAEFDEKIKDPPELRPEDRPQFWD